MTTDVVEQQLAAYGRYLDALFDEGRAVRRPAASPSRGGPRRARLLAAAVVVPVLLLGGALLLWPSSEDTVVSSAPPAYVALVPPSPPEGMPLSFATSDDGGGSALRVAVYGPADAVPGDVVAYVEEIPMAVVGEQDDTPGLIRIEVPVDAQRAIRVLASERAPLSELGTFAEGLVLGDDGSFEARYLPAGWVELWDHDTEPPFTSTYYGYDDGTDERYDVTTWSDAPAGSLFALHFVLDAEVIEVRDGRAAYVDADDPANPFVVWFESPGLAVMVQHSGGDVDEALAFVETVEAVDGDAWTSFAADAGPVEHDVATTTMAPPADVTVLVANATDRSGAASAVTASLEGMYDVLPPVNAISPERTSVVWFAPGHEEAAHDVASRLAQAVPVEPMPDDAPSAYEEADVIVVLGEDW